MALLFIRLVIFLALVFFVGILIRRYFPRSHRRRSVSPSPYEVLGVRPGASDQEIQEAYRSLLNQYHPDKVAHLGPDLRELAAEKTREILAAYEALRR